MGLSLLHMDQPSKSNEIHMYCVYLKQLISKVSNDHMSHNGSLLKFWDHHRTLNITNSVNIMRVCLSDPVTYANFSCMMSFYGWCPATDHGLTQSYVTNCQSRGDAHGISTVDRSRYVRLRYFLCGTRDQLSSFSISPHVSPTLYILSSSLTVSFSLQQHLCDSHWAGYPLLAGRGVESLSITRSHGWSAPDVNQARQLLWRLPVSSVHPLPADIMWWEMILNISTLGSDVSRGLERQKTLTDNTL